MILRFFVIFFTIVFDSFSGCVGDPLLVTISNRELYAGESSLAIPLTGIFGTTSTSLSIASCTSSNANLSVSCNNFSGLSSSIDLVANSSFKEMALVSISVVDNFGKTSNSMTFYVAPKFYKSCKELFDAGVTSDGTYLIDSDGTGGAVPYSVKCDMTNDGGGWTLLLNHDITAGGVFSSGAEVMENDIENVDSAKYSILSKIEDFRRGGLFEFRLNWPGLVNRNWWSQTSNPTTTSESVSGYTAINVDYTGSSWGGLSVSNNEAWTVLDGHPGHNNWWYAVGVQALYSGGMPGPGIITSGTSLWVK